MFDRDRGRLVRRDRGRLVRQRGRPARLGPRTSRPPGPRTSRPPAWASRPPGTADVSSAGTVDVSSASVDVPSAWDRGRLVRRDRGRPARHRDRGRLVRQRGRPARIAPAPTGLPPEVKLPFFGMSIIIGLCKCPVGLARRGICDDTKLLISWPGACGLRCDLQRGSCF